LAPLRFSVKYPPGAALLLATDARRALNVGDLLAILHEGADLLVLNKPAGLVCHPTKQDARSSLIGRVRLHLGDQVRPHLINRLDRETSGIVLVAKLDAAARELRRLWEHREVTKEYQAIVHGSVAQDEGEIDAPLGRDEGSAVAIKDCVRSDGAPAQTRYRVERRFRRGEVEFTLLRVWPRTGRKHQIRIHLAHLGHPLVGDKIYGGDEQVYLALVEGRLRAEDQCRLLLTHHALHAREVSFVWRDGEHRFRAEPSLEFTQFLETP
jgi:23S rRNA pseudouridine1911/1915/1917 synthase